MANSKTGAELSDSVLRRCGELTNGNSAYEAQVLEYLSHIQRTIILGGNEFQVDVNETWNWAKSKYPIILELKPKYNTGTLSVTNGSEVGAFSSAPAISLKGYHVRPNNLDIILVIRAHTAGQTAFEFDSAYPLDTDATMEYTAFKLDYELTPDYLIVDSLNKELSITDAGGTAVLSLTEGVYTPAQLATHIKTVADANATLTGTYTVGYDADLRKFSISTNSVTGVMNLGTGSMTKSCAALLGFNDRQVTITSTVYSDFMIGAIGKLIQPFQVYQNYNLSGEMVGMDEKKFQSDYPLHRVTEGIPTAFCQLHEDYEGRIIVRFNKYPSEDSVRTLVPYIPVPRDITDSALNKPLVPHKFIQVLEYGASHLVLIDKNDNKAGHYAQLTQSKLTALLKENRDEIIKSSKTYGEIIPRIEQIEQFNKRIQFRGYD